MSSRNSHCCTATHHVRAAPGTAEDREPPGSCAPRPLVAQPAAIAIALHHTVSADFSSAFALMSAESPPKRTSNSLSIGGQFAQPLVGLEQGGVVGFVAHGRGPPCCPRRPCVRGTAHADVRLALGRSSGGLFMPPRRCGALYLLYTQAVFEILAGCERNRAIC